MQIEAETGVKARTALRLFNSYILDDKTSRIVPPGRPALQSLDKRMAISAEVDANRHIPFPTLASQLQTSASAVRRCHNAKR